MDYNIIQISTQDDRDWQRYWLGMLCAFPHLRGQAPAWEQAFRSAPDREQPPPRKPRRVPPPGEF
jgi:hypothetical protein